jgi:hypothetical protein
MIDVSSYPDSCYSVLDMIVADVVGAWYTKEVPQLPKKLRAFLIAAADSMSLPLLLHTLFAPWRRDVVETEGLAWGLRWQAFWYNVLSILIGFTIRSFVLVGSTALLILFATFGVLAVAVFFVLPFLPVVLIGWGIFLLIK